MTDLQSKEKITALKKQIREMQEQRIKLEHFDQKVKKSTQKWNKELKIARKMAKPGEVLPSDNNVRVRIETAETKLQEFSENQTLLRGNYKAMTNTVYEMFKEIENKLSLDEKVKFERQIKYCANF